MLRFCQEETENAMIARLITHCGCKKEFPIFQPPQQYLTEAWTKSPTPLSPHPHIRQRQFELVTVLRELSDRNAAANTAAGDVREREIALYREIDRPAYYHARARPRHTPPDNLQNIPREMDTTTEATR